ERSRTGHFWIHRKEVRRGPGGENPPSRPQEGAALRVTPGLLSPPLGERESIIGLARVSPTPTRKCTSPIPPLTYAIDPLQPTSDSRGVLHVERQDGIDTAGQQDLDVIVWLRGGRRARQAPSRPGRHWVLASISGGHAGGKHLRSHAG